ncbi:DEBR0S1_25048g1_1 [Brettanomyces bruxellensis]|uniref:DEBR0S1_25048g1_1 n=1 Tax=Dekkera bruxellensis TaxID=5007 RepID=A0A7D9H061_DEKBR|nr:DEBR0S1_25048g1_1 [Brettanomyces bruxellensis]
MGKEAIREELVKRYVHTPLAPKTQASDFAASNMPMVAMFLRNKAIAWSAFFIAFQSYLNEPLISDPADQSQPPIMKIIFATVSVLVSYLDIIFPKWVGLLQVKLLQQSQQLHLQLLRLHLRLPLLL